MPSANIALDIHDHIARLTLNRPEAGNALTLTMARELMEAALQCGEDPTVRVVLLTGAGNTFCAGGDLKSFAATGDQLPRHAKEITTYLHAAISLLTRMQAPVIAAVQGSAAGGGMSLTCACDLVLAAESARFVVAYTRIGLTPDGSASYFLPRLIGLRRALELTLTNRPLSAQEAYDWGLVNIVTSDAELLSRAEALAAQLATGATYAQGVAKRLMRLSWNETLETQMATESQAIADAARLADAHEGIAAFLEKRPPRFH
ncbi:MAG TPA: enoyl-CoA hydratase-related protein [Ktedonobacterales bacterium]|nr:enoyl-CoA hydratase-related protein [Ktedonobacterales bacterium]